MILVRMLGGIDLIGAIAFLMLIFGIDVFTQFVLFSVGLLLLKGLFILTGEFVLSTIDLISALVLLLAIFFAIFPAILWALSFLLLAKGFVSFI